MVDKSWADDSLSSFLSNSAHRLSALSSRVKGSPQASPRGLIRFTVGNVDPDTFPTEGLTRAAEYVLSQGQDTTLNYGPAQGDLELRDLIAQRQMEEQHVDLSAEDISLTSGTTQSLHNICQTFLNPGDVVIAEAPAWRLFFRAAMASGAEVVSLPLDQHGPRLDILARNIEDLLTQGKHPKLLYTIPTYRNPTGTTMSPERREALLELAARHRILIIEDDAYSVLYFDGAPPPSLFSFSGGQGVLRLGTFSKTIATGLRVGWIEGKREYIRATVAMRFDNGTSPFVSRMISEFLKSGSFDTHVERVRTVYKAKWDTLRRVLSTSGADTIVSSHPEGGFFTWLTFPEGLQARDILQHAEEEGVAAAPGTSFYYEDQYKEEGKQFIRLCFSNVPLASVEEGVHRLLRAIDRTKE